MPNTLLFFMDRRALQKLSPPMQSPTKCGAHQAKAHRVDRGLSESHQPNFTHKGEGSLDAEARLNFRLLQRLRKATVFFDEIDDLLHKRSPTTDPTFMKFIVPAMLNHIQDPRDACPQQEICVIFVTNYFDQIEPALLRKGRANE
jgi:hypothetical protein